MRNDPNEEYVLSLSYGKDSLACLEACRILGQRIDRIVHAEVWATDTIPADLPPMVEFKKKADEIIKERYGLEVEHVCAMRKAVFPQTLISGTENLHTKNTSTPNRRDEITTSSQECAEDSQCNEEVGVRSSSTASGLEKVTYEKLFYKLLKPTSKTYQWRMRGGQRPIWGFPQIKGNWCTGLKQQVLNIPNNVQILGIAADEPKRIERHQAKKDIILPLVEVGWTEADCRKWCEDNACYLRYTKLP